MTQQEVQNWLLEKEEEGYRKFNASLIPGAQNLLGIRIPILRGKAKELAKEDWRGCMAWQNVKYFEERMLQAMVLGYAKAETEQLLAAFAAFWPEVDNWAVCDTLCQGFRIARKEPEAVWDFLMSYRHSHAVYEVRVVAVMLLSHYLDDTYIDRALDVLGNLKAEQYYARMGIAWAFATAWAKFPDKTRAYLLAHPIDAETYRKTLQKCIESYRVSAEEKAWIRKERRRASERI